MMALRVYAHELTGRTLDKMIIVCEPYLSKNLQTG